MSLKLRYYSGPPELGRQGATGPPQSIAESRSGSLTSAQSVVGLLVMAIPKFFTLCRPCYCFLAMSHKIVQTKSLKIHLSYILLQLYKD